MHEKALSLDGATLEIQNRSGYVILIDVLYTSDIKENAVRLDVTSGEKSLIEDVIRLEEMSFPYGENLIGVLPSPPSLFSLRVEAIISLPDSEEVAKQDRSVFGTDTGLIGIVDAGSFQEFVRHIDYNELVESLDYVDMLAYVSELHNKMGGIYCGFILTPGMDSGYDFMGSGRYRIRFT